MGFVESVVELVGKSIRWTVSVFIATLILLLLPRVTSGHFNPLPESVVGYVFAVCVLCGTYILVCFVVFLSTKAPEGFKGVRQIIARRHLSDLEIQTLSFLGKKPTEVQMVDELTHQTASKLQIVHACTLLTDKGYAHYDKFYGYIGLTDAGRALLVKKLHGKK
jgi:hypothetical protein